MAHNTLRDNKSGIVGSQQSRGTSSVTGRPYGLDKLYVYGNSLTGDGASGAVQDTGEDFSRSLVWERNVYSSVKLAPDQYGPFAWANGWRSGGWRSFGHDVSGSLS